MNYWVTTHWPPRVDEESETGNGVWLPDGRQQAAKDMRPGDYIAIYESKSGRTEIREHQDGSTIKVACKLGHEGMICYGTINSSISVICPPKADPLYELGLAKGDRSQCQENISRLNRSSVN